MSSRFSDQVVLVTGGSGALGRALSLAFPEEGATVAVTFRRQEEFDSLAKDLEGALVRANSILPGTIDTEANRKEMPDADISEWTKPEDIARVVPSLCSDDAKAIQGANICV